jgi:uncharacterized membrane protein
MNRVLISILSALGFAAILTFFPGEYFTAILLYFVLFFGISIFLGLRTYRRGMASAQEISKGKPIIEIDEKEVNKLLEKDKELMNEYKKFARASFMPLLTLPIFLVLFIILFPTLPPAAESALEPYIGIHLASQRLQEAKPPKRSRPQRRRGPRPWVFCQPKDACSSPEALPQT